MTVSWVLGTTCLDDDRITAPTGGSVGKCQYVFGHVWKFLKVIGPTCYLPEGKVCWEGSLTSCVPNTECSIPHNKRIKGFVLVKRDFELMMDIVIKIFFIIRTA